MSTQVYNINRFDLQECGILLGGYSDCKELVGVTHRRWYEWPYETG